jgi:hypothetical protein
VKLPSDALESLCDAAKSIVLGVPPPPASSHAINNVGKAGAPWLLSQRQWQCNQCDRPAVGLNQSMGLGAPLGEEVPMVITSVPWCAPYSTSSTWLANGL